jgi:hypothetical protein
VRRSVIFTLSACVFAGLASYAQTPSGVQNASGIRLVVANDNACATLEDDGVRFRCEFVNRSNTAYEMIYAPTDPRLTGIFHDVRLSALTFTTKTDSIFLRQKRRAD